MTVPERYETGLQGEELAEERLRAQGMVCLERRYRAAGGEIDLIMADAAGTVVFVEVKYRPGGRHGDGLTAVTPDKQRRVCRAADHYLTERGLWGLSVRYDIV